MACIKPRGQQVAHLTLADKKKYPTDHEPNSSMDLNDVDGTKHRRYFDENGKAIEDVDYRHSNGDGSHTFPHRHGWDWNTPTGKPRRYDMD